MAFADRCPHAGILISISLITALGVAVLESPQIQEWLEQQRRRLVELLRGIGEELDPQSRRTAEAFAFEGRSPATDDGIRREVSGSQEAAAIATGRTLSSPSTIRRIPIQGPADPDEAAERRRKGREYLAKRNQQMYELQQRKKAAKAEGVATPPTPTSFDAMVDEEGKLRLLDTDKALPSAPEGELESEAVTEMRELKKNFSQPIREGQADPSTADAGWSFGSLVANPFGDEYALDRSDTPKPPVPPKVALETVDGPPISTIPGSFTPRRLSPRPEIDRDSDREDLTYEEQLAIAIALSESEAAKSVEPRLQDVDDFDVQLRAAIEASLNEDRSQKAPVSSSTAASAPAAREPENLQPLVDLTPPSPSVRPQAPPSRGRFETIFDQQYSPSHEPLSLGSNASQPDEEDELYRVTPELTHARLATLNSQQSASASTASPPMRYDPVREAASQTLSQQQDLPEASFHSAASSAPSPASTETMDFEHTPQLIDITDIAEDAPAEGARTPTSRAPSGFPADTESDSDTFASMSNPASRAQSRPRSEISNVEVLDITNDSDVDMLSEEGDGIATPDSWTEVGSQDGESEEDERPARGLMSSTN